MFLAELAAFAEASQRLSDMELLQPSRCSGWSRLDAIVHTRAGLEEMLVGYFTLTASEADHDAASHRGSHPDDRDADPVPHILWLRRTASAYGRPRDAVRHLKAVSDQVRRVVAGSADRTVHFQNMTLTGGDFLATWTVELGVHHLDLDLTESSPTPPSLDVTKQTIEAIAMHPIPAGLSGDKGLLAALGRTPWPDHVPTHPSYPVSL